MTTIHAQRIGGKVLLSEEELERLVDLARRSDEVALHVVEDELPTLALMRLAEQAGSFDFWLQDGEEIYSVEDGEPA